MLRNRRALYELFSIYWKLKLEISLAYSDAYIKLNRLISVTIVKTCQIRSTFSYSIKVSLLLFESFVSLASSSWNYKEIHILILKIKYDKARTDEIVLIFLIF